MNCQLYRTNILLGGQMKYDLIVDGDSTINDVHITPISDRAPYGDRYMDTNILNYENQGNIRDFYKKTQGNFYNTFVDPLLESEYPLPEQDKGYKLYDDSTWMGCSRMEYKLYNKQFQFFVPIWLDEKINDIKFRIVIKSLNQDNSIILVNKEIDFSEKVKKYFMNYFNYIELDDRLIKIDFAKDECILHGVNASTGLIETKKEFTLVPTLKHRERPLLEFDSMIVNTLVNNTLIAKQLINFNLCFNIDDLMDPDLTRVISLPSEYNFTTSVQVIVNGEELELRDFFNNYEYIKKSLIPYLDSEALRSGEVKYVNDVNSVSLNVLDYLKDYKCVDLINKNKVDQKIFHWSLYNSDDYIFNLYDGFGGVLYTGDIITHKHGISFAPVTGNYIYGNESWCWCPYLDIDIHTINRYKIDTLKKSCVVCENMMCDVKFGGKFNNDKTYHCMMASYNDDIDNTSIYTLFGDVKFINKYSLIYLISYEGKNDVYIIILGRTPEDLMFNNVLNDLKKYSKLQSLSSIFVGNIDKTDLGNLKSFYNYLNSIILPSSIVIEKSICGKHAQSPSIDSDEIKYYKVDSDFLQYLFRYDGKIKPTFIDPKTSEYKNYLYLKKIIKDNSSDDMFFEYINTNFQPRYPSIGYYSFEDPIDIDYDSIIHDGKWFNNGSIKNYRTKFTLELMSEDGIDDIINEYKNIYDITYDISMVEDKYYYKINFELK